MGLRVTRARPETTGAHPPAASATAALGQQLGEKHRPLTERDSPVPFRLPDRRSDQQHDVPSTTKGAGRTGSTHGEMNRPLPGENPAGVALGNADPVRRRRGFWVLGPWVGTGLLVLLAALVGGAWVGLSSGAPTTGSPATTAPAATASDAAGASASKAAKTAKTGKAAGGALTADFSGDAGAWTPLTGTWKIKGGTTSRPTSRATTSSASSAPRCRPPTPSR